MTTACQHRDELALLANTDEPAIPEASAASANFADVARQSGIHFKHVFRGNEYALKGLRRQLSGGGPVTIVETIGSGCAFVDFDSDGNQDVLLIQSGEDFTVSRQAQSSRFYRNNGSGQFEDVTAKMGVVLDAYGMGCCAGDYDNDGFVDIYVTNYGNSNVLLRNNGDGTFTDVTDETGTGGNKDLWSTSCAFADVNSDGWLDLYVANYVDYNPKRPYCRQGRVQTGCMPNVYSSQPNLMFMNLGDGRFVEKAHEMSIDNPRGTSLGVVFSDFDNDGRVDLYVANDGTPNALFRNRGGGRFDDITLTAGVGYSENGATRAGMGTDAGDIDGDGLFDIIVTNFQHEGSGLFCNLGHNSFTDRATAFGLGVSTLLRVGFGVCFFDYDHDGDADIYVGNGHVFDNVAQFDSTATYAQQDQLFANEHDRFVDISAHAGPAFRKSTVTRAVAAGDFDNDGTSDILCNDSGGNARLLSNKGTVRNHWVGLILRGIASNRSAIGARAECRVGGRLQVKEVRSGSSYLSQSDLRLIFGIKNISDPDSVRISVRWPSGMRESVKVSRVDAYLSVREGEGQQT